MAKRTDIWVYAHWKGMEEPKCIGVLSAQQAKGRKSFSFSYDDNWIASQEQLLLDPDIAWFGGQQYPNGKENFGAFLDSMPDTWGRTLMKRRAAINADLEGKPAPTLYDIDYLLGVHDLSRMGALRFKTDPDGDFLDNDPVSPTPPWANIRELQHGAALIESNKDTAEVRKWLTILMAPGSSLGGARPKANIIDEENNLWIAKFPSTNDTIDKGAWEYLAYRLAINAGIKMADCRIERIINLLFDIKKIMIFYANDDEFILVGWMICHSREILNDFMLLCIFGYRTNNFFKIYGTGLRTIFNNLDYPIHVKQFGNTSLNFANKFA